MRYTHFEEICLFIKKEIIESINIFKIDIRFTGYLFPLLFIYKLKKDEMIYRKGDPKDEIYFIYKGKIIYLNEEGHELLVL